MTKQSENPKKRKPGGVERVIRSVGDWGWKEWIAKLTAALIAGAAIAYVPAKGVNVTFQQFIGYNEATN